MDIAIAARPPAGSTGAERLAADNRAASGLAASAGAALSLETRLRQERCVAGCWGDAAATGFRAFIVYFLTKRRSRRMLNGALPYNG
jgi:hypothetical protein